MHVLNSRVGFRRNKLVLHAGDAKGVAKERGGVWVLHRLKRPNREDRKKTAAHNIETAASANLVNIEDAVFSKTDVRRSQNSPSNLSRICLPPSIFMTAKRNSNPIDAGQTYRKSVQQRTDL